MAALLLNTKTIPALTRLAATSAFCESDAERSTHHQGAVPRPKRPAERPTIPVAKAPAFPGAAQAPGEQGIAKSRSERTSAPCPAGVRAMPGGSTWSVAGQAKLRQAADELLLSIMFKPTAGASLPRWRRPAGYLDSDDTIRKNRMVPARLMEQDGIKPKNSIAPGRTTRHKQANAASAAPVGRGQFSAFD